MSTPAPNIVAPVTCPTCGGDLDHVSSTDPDPFGAPTLSVAADLVCPPCGRLFRLVVSIIDVTPTPAGHVETRRRAAAALAATETNPSPFL